MANQEIYTRISDFNEGSEFNDSLDSVDCLDDNLS